MSDGPAAEPFLAEEMPAALDGERVDRVVSLLTGCSRSEAAALVEQGGVQVGGTTVTKGSHRVHEGEVVTLAEDPARPPVTVEPDPSVEVPVLHEDEDVLVVDKPPGLVVHPGAGHARGTLVAGLVARYPELAVVGEPARPGLVHRLDRDTSGLLLVARTPEAHAHLVDQLRDRMVERRYLALVDGHPESARGVVDAPIGRSPRHPTLMEVRADGRPARTHYEVQERFADPAPVALLACRLETGRTHQIRVHLKAIGHPVVGDDRYVGATRAVPCPRTFLHAEHLAFRHPVTGERVAVHAPLPADLAAVLPALRTAP